MISIWVIGVKVGQSFYNSVTKKRFHKKKKFVFSRKNIFQNNSILLLNYQFFSNYNAYM